MYFECIPRVFLVRLTDKPTFHSKRFIKIWGTVHSTRSSTK